VTVQFDLNLVSSAFFDRLFIYQLESTMIESTLHNLIYSVVYYDCTYYCRKINL